MIGGYCSAWDAASALRIAILATARKQQRSRFDALLTIAGLPPLLALPGHA
ncbi:MAG: hypothetical protein IT305_21665 [Chloroflexi bacterium]|nr:hypothetical protein [Chloroflexota bacterium]